MITTGKVTNVYIGDAAGDLESVVNIGMTQSFSITRPHVFSETGGRMELNGEVVTFTSVDVETGVMTLDGPSPVEGAIGDPVYVYPRGATKWAQVDLDDDDEGIRVALPMSLYDRVEDGIRPTDEQESITVTDERGFWEVVEFNEEIPSIDGSLIRPDTLPAPVIPDVPVTISPTPTVVATVKSLHVNWESTDGTQTIVQVHVSTTPGYVPVKDDPATYVGETAGTGLVVDKLADGTELEAMYDDDGNPATPEVPRVYWVRTLAYAPANPTGVEASEAIPAGLKLITGGDVAYDAVWAGYMAVDRLLGGNVDVTMNLRAGGEISATGADGSKVKMSGSEGFLVSGPTSLNNPTYVSFPVDGRPNIISGTLQANTLAVEGDPVSGQAATFRRNSVFEPGATLTFNDSIAPPLSAPLMESVEDTDSIGSVNLGVMGAATIFGGVWYSGNLYFVENFTANRVMKWDPVAGTVTILTTLAYGARTDLYLAGIVRVSGTDGWRSFWRTSQGTESYVQKHREGDFVSLGSMQIAAPGGTRKFNQVMGSDGTDVWIASQSSTTTNGIQLRRFKGDMSTNAVQETINTTVVLAGSSSTPAILSLLVGSFDFGARKFLLTTQDGDNTATKRMYALDTAGARDTNSEFKLMGGSSNPSWLFHDGTVFRDFTY